MIPLAAAAGFGLSFLGLGMLWIGRPWLEAPVAALFAAAAWAATRAAARGGAKPETAALALAAGAAPLGLLLTKFRDAHDSHLIPVLIVLSWAAGTAAGAYLGARGAASR